MSAERAKCVAERWVSVGLEEGVGKRTVGRWSRYSLAEHVRQRNGDMK